jgi:general secretion pathway protein J
MDRGTGGFTLIELLAAIAVLGVLAVLAFRGLGSVLEAEARVGAEARRWSDTATVFEQMSRDLSRTVARPVRALRAPQSDGEAEAALVLRAQPAGAGAQLEISRHGDAAEGAAQGALRRVGYRLRDETLEYLLWPALDAAPGATPAAYPVLAGVTALRLRALGADGAWRTAWPSGAPRGALPRAVEAQLVLAGGARITRILLVQ